MADGSTGASALYRMVIMRYTKFQMPSWKTGIIKTICAIPVEQIRDLILLIFVLVGLVVFAVSPLLLSVFMPTGT